MGTHAPQLNPPPRFARRPRWPARPTTGVRLTFDDGPKEPFTSGVLDVLDEFGLTATFFVVGKRVAGAAHLLRRMHTAGHTIGNHTFTHPPPSWVAFPSAVREVRQCQRAVSEVIGTAPTLFRPPMGRWTPALWAARTLAGLKPLGWTLDSGDWRVRSAADADECAAELLAAVRPGDVILLHDYHPWIERILRAVLPELVNPLPSAAVPVRTPPRTAAEGRPCPSKSCSRSTPRT
jgi:peptidoglycan/xylan/chitin deacetylase (PgdA/CDA1 family)